MATEADKLFNEIQHPKKRALLIAFCESGNITQSAAAAECERTIHYYWLQEDPAYAKAFEQAEARFADNLEAEARRRAIQGSDTLMIFLLKGAKPDRYADRSKVALGGDANSPLKIVWESPQSAPDGE